VYSTLSGERGSSEPEASALATSGANALEDSDEPLNRENEGRAQLLPKTRSEEVPYCTAIS